MSHQILNDGDTGFDFRTKINTNFLELFKVERTKAVVATITPVGKSITTSDVTIPIADTIIYATNMSYDIPTGVFTNIDGGLYKFDFFLLANWNNGVDIYLSAWVDGVQIGTDVRYTGEGAAKNVAISIPYYTVLDNNQEIEIKIRADSALTLNIENASIGLDLQILGTHLP